MTISQPTRMFERRFWQLGATRVAGVDEVGRGPLAGPLTVAAVVLPRRCRLAGLRDSKLMTPAQRQRLAKAIQDQALMIGIGWASCDEIDEYGLTAATRSAGLRALAGCAADQIILDGNFNYLSPIAVPVLTRIKADQTCLAVAAASVIAKVARDDYMEKLGGQYPEYGFANHKGYGSARHLAALDRYGPCKHHRLSFAPVRLAAGVER